MTDKLKHYGSVQPVISSYRLSPDHRIITDRLTFPLKQLPTRERYSNLLGHSWIVVKHTFL